MYARHMTKTAARCRAARSLYVPMFRCTANYIIFHTTIGAYTTMTSLLSIFEIGSSAHYYIDAFFSKLHEHHHHRACMCRHHNAVEKVR